MKFKTAAIPIAVLVCAALILLLASTFMQPVAAASLQQDTQACFEQLLPGSKTFAPEAYTGDNENISAVYRGETGYIVEAGSNGYVNRITLWIGVDNSGAITGLTVRDMTETFGLGQNALYNLNFLSQFVHTRGDAAVGENVDALTGATVTSKAIAKAVNSASAYVTGADVSSGATQWGG